MKALRYIRPALAEEMAKTVSASLVQSRMVYANTLFFGTSAHHIRQLQRVQHRFDFVVLDNPTLNNDHRLVQLHWLPIQQMIYFKTALLTHKTIATSQPSVAVPKLSTAQT